MTWSKRSRRQLSTQRSATPFCQGLSKEVRIGVIVRDRTAAGTSNPYLPSRSKMRNRGADSNGNASRNCCATHRLVGCLVTLRCRMRRRRCPRSPHAEFAEQKARRAVIGGAARRARTTFLRCQNRGESSRVGLHPRLKRLHRWIQPPALCDFHVSARKVNT